MLKKCSSLCIVFLTIFLATFVACKKCNDLPAPTVSITVISNTVVKATWNTIDNAESYEVVLANETTSNKADISTVEVTTNQATFEGITVKSAMVVRVTPRCKNGKLGTNTGTSSTFVLTSPCDLAAPKKMKVSPINASAAKLSWDNVSGAVGYQITVKNLTTQAVRTINVQTSPFNLDGLEAGTKYEISIAPKCSDDSISTSRLSNIYEHFIIIDDTVIMFGSKIPDNICTKDGIGVPALPLIAGNTLSKIYDFDISDTSLGIVGGCYHLKVVDDSNTSDIKVSDFKMIYARFGKEIRIMPYFGQCTGDNNYPTQSNTDKNVFSINNIDFIISADHIDIVNNSSTDAKLYIE